MVATIALIAFVFCSASMVGCGGGSVSATTTQSVTSTQAGPPSGSEFLYSFYFASDIQVAPLNSSTGAVGSTVDATPNLFPAIENAFAAQYGKFLYVLGFDQSYFSQDVWIFSITGVNGELTAVDNSPFYIAGGTAVGSVPVIDKVHGRLYTSGTFLDANQNTVFTLSPYTIDANDGSLSAENSFEEKGLSQGTYSVAPVIDPLGRYIYELAYTPAGVEVFDYAIDPATGELSEVPGSPFMVAPSSTVTNYLGGQLFPSPSGNFLNASMWGGTGANYSSDVNNFYVLAVDPTTGALASIPGSPFPTEGYPMTPNGEFLFVPGNGPVPAGACTSSISTFAVDPLHGTIGTTPISTVTGGFGCPDQIDPTGTILISTDQRSNDATAWSLTINETTGALTPVAGSPFTLPNMASPPSFSYESSFIVKVP
jgi:hypothetical protein